MRLPADLMFLDIDDMTTLIVEPNYAHIESPEPWTYRERSTTYDNPFMTDEPAFDSKFADQWEHGV
jgi:hypothetical protein